MKKLKDFKNNNPINNNMNIRRRGGAGWFMMLFMAIFIALSVRVLGNGGIGGAGNNIVAPLELSFSDVLRRAPDIKAMNVN